MVVNKTRIVGAIKSSIRLNSGFCKPKASNASSCLGPTICPAGMISSLDSTVTTTLSTASAASWRSTSVRSSSGKVLGLIRSSVMLTITSDSSSGVSRDTLVGNWRRVLLTWLSLISALIASPRIARACCRVSVQSWSVIIRIWSMAVSESVKSGIASIHSNFWAVDP